MRKSFNPALSPLVTMFLICSNHSGTFSIKSSAIKRKSSALERRRVAWVFSPLAAFLAAFSIRKVFSYIFPMLDCSLFLRRVRIAILRALFKVSCAVFKICFLVAMASSIFFMPLPSSASESRLALAASTFSCALRFLIPSGIFASFASSLAICLSSLTTSLASVSNCLREACDSFKVVLVSSTCLRAASSSAIILRDSALLIYSACSSIFLKLCSDFVISSPSFSCSSLRASNAAVR